MNITKEYKDVSIWPDKFKAKMVTFYIGSILLLYPLDRFMPSVRFGSIFYIDIPRLFIIIGLFIMFCNFCLTHRLKVDIRRIDIAITLFAMYILASSFWSISEWFTLRQAYWFLYFISFYFLVIASFDSIEYKFLYSYFMIAPIILLIVCIIIYLDFGTLRPNKLPQLKMYFVGSVSNYISATSEIGLPFLFSILIFGKKNYVIMSSVSIIASFVILIFTESRGSALIIVFMTVCFCIFVAKQKMPRSKILFNVLLLLLAFITLYLVYHAFRDQLLENFVDRIKSLQNVEKEGRYWLFQKGISVAFEKPFFGWGFGTHAIVFFKRYSVYIDSHNAFLTIFQGLGLVGLFWFLLIIISALKRAYRVFHDYAQVAIEKKLFALSVFISLSGTVLHGFTRQLTENSNFYFLLACAFALFKKEVSKRST